MNLRRSAPVCGHCERVRVPPERSAKKTRCPKVTNRCSRSSAGVTSESFDKTHTRDLPVVVDFWAPWCARAARWRRLEERQAASSIRFAWKVNSERSDDLGRFGFAATTLIAFKHGREIRRQVGGMDNNGLLQWLGWVAVLSPSPC